ncbi:MAG: sulfurtransferase TusA family protein [Candidatus Obscuribacterales bacterium]
MTESGERFIDAGEMGCGELVMLLKTTMSELSPGDRIRVIALDPGAPVDLPAWCRLTGHSLERSEHPEYLIRKKENG